MTVYATAAEHLYRTWMNGDIIDALPPNLQPQTKADGYRIQACFEGFSAKPLFGWKIAATSIAGQKHIGVDGPLAGRLLAERVVAPGAQLSLRHNRMRVIEAEFAFRMATTLEPRSAPYSQREVLAAVASLHPAIEIPDSRYRQFEKIGAPMLIADCACANLFMLGPESTAPWRHLDLSQHVVAARKADGSVANGLGSNVLGDPRIALTWIANELSGIGVPLKAGQVVTTGTCLVPLVVAPGDQVSVDFGALGQLGISFS